MENGVTFSFSEKTLTAHLSGEIDHHSAKPVREAVDSELFKMRPEVLVLDFSRVKFMDSSGIGLIIGRAEVCASLLTQVRLSGVNPTLKKLMKLSGIEKIKNISI